MGYPVEAVKTSWIYFQLLVLLPVVPASICTQLSLLSIEKLHSIRLSAQCRICQILKWQIYMIVYQNLSIYFIRNKFQLNVSENSKQYQIFMSTFSSLIWQRTAEYFLDFRSCRKILGNSQIVKMHHLNLSSSLCKSSGSRQKALLTLWTKILSYKICF